MFVRSGNSTVQFFLPLTLAFQGHTFVKITLLAISPLLLIKALPNFNMRKLKLRIRSLYRLDKFVRFGKICWSTRQRHTRHSIHKNNTYMTRVQFKTFKYFKPLQLNVLNYPKSMFILG